MITSLDSKPNEVLEPDGNREGLVNFEKWTASTLPVFEKWTGGGFTLVLFGGIPFVRYIIDVRVSVNVFTSLRVRPTRSFR